MKRIEIKEKCPVCAGTGLVSRPPWIAGDQPTWASSSIGPWPCKVCDGTGLIPVKAEPLNLKCPVDCAYLDSEGFCKQGLSVEVCKKEIGLYKDTVLEQEVK